MAKTLSEEEIEELLKNGASVDSDNVELSLAGMTQLLGQMRTLVEVNKQIANRNNNDLVNAVNNLTMSVNDKSFKPQDLRPLVDTIMANNKPIEPPKPTAYKHEFTRNSRGLLTSMTSTPVGPLDVTS